MVSGFWKSHKKVKQRAGKKLHLLPLKIQVKKKPTTCHLSEEITIFYQDFLTHESLVKQAQGLKLAPACFIPQKKNKTETHLKVIKKMAAGRDQVAGQPTWQQGEKRKISISKRQFLSAFYLPKFSRFFCRVFALFAQFAYYSRISANP